MILKIKADSTNLKKPPKKKERNDIHRQRALF